MARVIAFDRAPELDAETRARLDEADEAIGDVAPPEIHETSVELPTADDPMHGLSKLSAVAVVGREKFVELSERKISYVWPPVASRGWVVMLCAPPGLGKTTLLVMLLVARANTGAPVEVLGLPVEPAPAGTYVLFVEGEVDEIAIARKLRGTCALLGVDESALDRIIVIPRKGVRVGDPVWMEAEKLIAAALVSDIGLDSVARCAPAGSDTNDEAQQTALFDSLARAVDLAPNAESKPVCWLIAHSRKGGSGGLDDVLGSRARTAQIDSLIMLDGEKSNGRVLHVTAIFEKLRHDVDEHPEPVTITIDRDPVTRAQRLTVGNVTKDDRPLEAQIESLLAKHPDGLTKSKIADTLGRNRGDVQTAIDALFAVQKLSGATIKTKTGSYSGVRLREAFPKADERRPASRRTHKADESEASS